MKNLSLFDSIYIASFLFLVGSAIFTFEAMLEILKSASILSLAHFLACLLFTLGSFLFLRNSRKS